MCYHTLQFAVLDRERTVYHPLEAGQVLANILVDPPVLVPDVEHRVDDALDVLGRLLVHTKLG